MKILVSLLFMLAVFSPAGADETKGREENMPAATLDEMKKSFDHAAQVLGSVSLKCKIEVFEGLPHPRWEPDLLATESKRGISFEDHEFLFYSPASRITNADSSALRQVLQSVETYRRFGGFKACGGYHPDFLIRLIDGNTTITIQLCFGCHEARFFKDSQIVYCDLNSESFTLLQAILEDYYLERPDKKQAAEALPSGGDKLSN